MKRLTCSRLWHEDIEQRGIRCTLSDLCLRSLWKSDRVATFEMVGRSVAYDDGDVAVHHEKKPKVMRRERAGVYTIRSLHPSHINNSVCCRTDTAVIT